MHENAPLYNAFPATLKASLKKTRQDKKKLEKELKKVRRLIRKEGVKLNPGQHTDMVEILENAEPGKMDTIADMFWSEQQTSGST